MTAQLVVGPHSSSSLLRSDSTFTCDTINLTNLNLSNQLNTESVNVNTNYKINNVGVLTTNALGVGVTSSNLQQVGTL